MKQKKRNSKGFRKGWGYLREDKPVELSGKNIEGRRVDFPKEANVFSNKPMPKEIGISAITKKDVEEFVDQFYMNYGNMMSKLSRE